MQNSTMRPYRTFLQKACVFLCAFLLLGCNTLRLGYNNGESIAYWWLNSYVDFQADQEPFVRRHIAQLFHWHRTTQLQEYAQLLEQTRQPLGREVTQSDVLARYDAVKKSTLLVIDKALPELTDLALSLRPEQIAHIEKKFASNNEKFRREYLRGDLERRQHNRYKTVMKHADYWFGDFSEEQKAQIRAVSNARPLDNELLLEARILRQQELIALLKKIQSEKPRREAAMAMLKGYAAGVFAQFGNAEQKRFTEAATRETAAMIATIVNLATPEQKRRADQRVERLIADFHAMARRAG